MRLRRKTLVREYRREAALDLSRPDALEVKSLKAAEDRRRRLRDLLRFSCRKDKDNAGRRLFENLEKSVPRLTSQHVRLVDDVHLVALVSGGRVHRAFAKVACVVDAAVGGRIDLHDVETRCAAPYTFARHAHATRLAVLTAVLAVERHREHASERRFADAARSAQQVAMRNSAARNRALQRRRHVRLHGDIAEALRAVFASEGDHGMERRVARDALREFTSCGGWCANLSRE